MGQSLNLYMGTASGRRLSDMYMLAWEKGLKTTYYLRSLGAGGVEQSTVDINRRGIQPRWMRSRSASSGIHVERGGAEHHGTEHHSAEHHGAAHHGAGDGSEATGSGLGGGRSAPWPGAGSSAPAPVCNLDGDCESCQ
jgi:ribonucleoside-diphosphate reductase alpha chain